MFRGIKPIICALVLALGFSFLPSVSNKAEAVVYWDGVELKPGQIGRLTVLKQTPLYKLVGNKKVFVRNLKPGQTFRIYTFKPGMLGLGGGYYINRDGRVKYETPSKAKLEQVVLDQYAKKLSSIQIINGNEKISLGKWTIREIDGMLYIEANSIPQKSLKRIFAIYDTMNIKRDGRYIKPLEIWAEKVLNEIEKLTKIVNKPWSIDVGNNCVAEYPKTLPTDLIVGYSGSCGYSIPVLTGSSEEASLLLLLTEEVVINPDAFD